MYLTCKLGPERNLLVSYVRNLTYFFENFQSEFWHGVLDIFVDLDTIYKNAQDYMSKFFKGECIGPFLQKNFFWKMSS